MPTKVLGTIVWRLGTAAVALLLACCATPPPADDPEARAEFEQMNDPYEPANRAMMAVNDVFDDGFLRPLAMAYHAGVPAFARDRVADFLENLRTPLTLVNDLLQGNFDRTGRTVERFAVNSTFGVGGLMDVGSHWGMPGHQSDFGQTFAVWGVEEGPYLYLPILGPSNPRDGIGLGVESVSEPLGLYCQMNHMLWLSYARTGGYAVSQREAYLDSLDEVRRSSFDYYAALRSLYRQHRAGQIDEAKRDKSPSAN